MHSPDAVSEYKSAGHVLFTLTLCMVVAAPPTTDNTETELWCKRHHAAAVVFAGVDGKRISKGRSLSKHVIPSLRYYF